MMPDFSEELVELMEENRLDIRGKTITLRDLCRGLQIELPERVQKIADNYYTMSFRAKRVHKGDICLIIRSPKDFHTNSVSSRDLYETAIKKGASLIIMSRSEFEENGLNEEDFPVILLEDDKKSVAAFSEKLRANQHGKVIMLTGSIGKTTTKDMCYAVARPRFRTFANQKNTNTPHQVYQFLYENYNAAPDVYIQEAGAGYFGSVRFSAEILKPDIFILTNVYNHHFQVYKTFENLFEDKTSADEVMGQDGIIITNYDDENIRNHQFSHKVVSFAVHYEDADYTAMNIHQEMDILRFDVCERSTGDKKEVRIHILGEHNVYNALAAYALGRTLGLSPEMIAEDLFAYRTSGVRQNFMNIGGVYLNMDCYNAAEESIATMLQAGEKLKMKEGGRRIALIGGENKLGRDVRLRSNRFGRQIGNTSFDYILFCGRDDMSTKSLNHFGDAQDIQAGFSQVSDKQNSLALSIEQMEEFLRKYVKRNDLVMVKGLYYLDMPIAVDRAFGTSFSFGLSNYIESRKKYKENGYTMNVIRELRAGEVTQAPVENGILKIPNEIAGFQVFRAADHAFENRKELRKLEISTGVQNIGAWAFSNTGLTTAVIPGTVKVIEEGAFSNNPELAEVSLQTGTTHIGENAFANCGNLKEINIPASVGMIEENAFQNTECIFLCEEESYAHGYALLHGIPFRAQ